MPSRAESPAPRRRGLRIIALFKFTKVVLCVVAALALLKLLAPGQLARLGDWVTHLPMAPGRRIGEHLLASFMSEGPGRVRLAAGVALGYAALFAVEGTGLWLERRWGEYFTVVVTGTGIPIELYEITRHPTALSIGSLVVNLTIVAYLVWQLRRER